MDKALIQAYKEQGFIKFKLFSSDEVDFLRKKILSNIVRGSVGEYYIDYYKSEFDRDVFFGHTALVNNLNALFPEVIYMPDLNIQVNRIDQTGFKRGWHIDCGTEYALRRQYLFDENYKFLKVGIYLQDDTLEFGGGIEIQRKSHHLFYRAKNSKFSKIFLSSRVNFPHLFNAERLSVASGDAVLFDSRLLHRSSSNIVPVQYFSNDDAKIAIYWTVAGSKFLAESYYSALVGNALDPSCNEISRNFHKTFFSFYFPDDFLCSAFDESNAKGIKWHTFDRGLASYFFKLRNNNKKFFNEFGVKN